VYKQIKKNEILGDFQDYGMSEKEKNFTKSIQKIKLLSQIDYFSE
jgi:hypothetical protein